MHAQILGSNAGNNGGSQGLPVGTGGSAQSVGGGAPGDPGSPGGRDSDLFPSAFAEGYARADREVLRTNRPVIDQAELVKNTDGSVDWFITTKLPLLDKAGRAVGECGFTRDVKKVNLGNAQLLSWAPALEFIVNNYASRLEVPALARRLQLSVSQFNRQFRKRFHTTPKAYKKRAPLPSFWSPRTFPSPKSHKEPATAT